MNVLFVRTHRTGKTGTTLTTATAGGQKKGKGGNAA